MGKQINFYRNKEIEQRILEKSFRLRLLRFDRNSGPFFAYVDPTDDWLEADAIQYSQSNGTDQSQGRFWTGSMNPEFLKIFYKLTRFIRSNSKFHKESGLWVWKKYREEFEDYFRRTQDELDEIVRKNKEYAQKELGAKISS